MISFSKLQRYFILCVLALMLTACAEHVAERRGTQVDVVPVIYSLSLKIAPEQKESAEKELDLFLQENNSIVLTQNIELIWYSEVGEYLANNTHKKLLKKGVSDKNIKFIQGGRRDVNRFDYEINLIVHKVLLQVCQNPKVTHYGRPGDGCYTESARWQSMVNPENMLNQSTDAEYTNR